MGTAKERKSYQIKGYVGLNGSGKTWLMMQEAKREKRQIRIRLNRLDPTLAKGAKVIFTWNGLLKHVKKNHKKGFEICWDGSKNYDLKTSFQMVADIAMTFGYIAILADEAHRYCERNFEDTQPHLAALLGQNFHYRTSFYWTSTRPRAMSPEFRTQSNSIALFDNYDPTYVGYLRTVASKSLVEALHDAVDYSYILVSRNQRPKLMPPYKK